MYTFSKTSLKNLEGVHPILGLIVHKALDTGIMDFSVKEGLRTKERQLELFNAGKSKTMNSKHLIQDCGYSLAVDLYPHPFTSFNDWRDVARFGVLAGIIRTVSLDLGKTVQWGGDWNSDGETLDESFTDFPHFQLKLN